MRASIFLAGVAFFTATAWAAQPEVWRLYGQLPDGTTYRWRTDTVVSLSNGVYDVVCLNLYGKPHAIATSAGSHEERAVSALLTMRVSCADKTVQTRAVDFFDARDEFVTGNDSPQAVEAARPGTVGGRLVDSVCRSRGGAR